MTDELDYLRLLNEHGIGFVVALPSGGAINLEPEAIQFYLVDPESYWARHYKISKLHFIDWDVWHRTKAGYQCEHVNAKHKRCRNRAQAPQFPYEYDPDAPKLCVFHRKAKNG